MKMIKKKSHFVIKCAEREVKLHQSLKHPNIIQFVDYLDTPDTLFIFLEYAENGDLFRYLQRKSFSSKQLLNFFHQTCLAMQYIHDKNIMHRDLKPENILVSADNKIKLCDFGYSAEYDKNEVRQTLCGTYEYMAPEVIFNGRQTKKTDIWALGILLYELFHGQAPFKGQNIEEVMLQIKKGLVGFKRHLNPLLKDLIVKILVMNPLKRPSIEEILAHGLLSECSQRSFQAKLDGKSMKSCCSSS